MVFKDRPLDDITKEVSINRKKKTSEDGALEILYYREAEMRRKHETKE